MGGNTTSAGFAVSATAHGFLMAFDEWGNPQWGTFYYNVTFALTTVSGCRMSSDGSSLSVYGLGNSQPVFMEVDTNDGSIINYISLEWSELTEDNTPVITTYRAMYHDKRDSFDQQQYVYQAFLMEDTVQLLRV
jgi:hypothetical protein